MSRRRLLRRGLVATGIVVLAGLVLQSTPVCPAADRQELRYIYVPEDEPDVWPAGDWVPLSRDQFVAARQRLSQSLPSPAYLESATYRARFVGNELRGGTLSASARLRTGVPQYIDLGEPSLALRDLRWNTETAIWGTSPRGQKLLRIDDDSATLNGRWSLTGRSIFSTVEFEIAVSPALVTQFQLDVPETHEVAIEGGLVSRVDQSDKSGWNVWSLDLGQRTTCRLLVTRRPTEAGSAGAELHVSQVAKYSLRPDLMQIQADVTLQAMSGVVNQLEFTVPTAITVSSITLGGDIDLPVHRVQDGASPVVQVDVTGLKLSRGMTIRLRGEMALVPGRPRSLPRLGLRRARWLSLRREVVIERPLQVKDLQMTGCLLVQSSIAGDTGSTLTLEDATRNSQVTLTVDSPQPDLAADVLSVFHGRQSDPLLMTILKLESLAGAAFTVDCHVPREWDVTRVESKSSIPVAQWVTESVDADGATRLRIELASALSPQRPTEIVVWSRPRFALAPPTMGLPTILPLISGRRTSRVAIEFPPRLQLSLPADSGYETVPLETARASWGHVVRDELTAAAHDGWLLLQSADPAENESLAISDAMPLAAAAAAASVPPVTSVSAPSATSEHSSELAPEAAVPADLNLETVVADRGGELCRSRAVLDIALADRERRLNITVPEAARLLQASVVRQDDGSVLRVEPRDNATLEVSLPAATPAQVIVEYTSPLTRSMISGTAVIPIPRWNGSAQAISWSVVLPAGHRLTSPTDGSRIASGDRLSWSHRLLGPLGRSIDRNLFWPFSVDSWRALLAGDVPQAGAGAGSRTPQNARQVVTRSVSPGQTSLQLAYWQVSAALRLGWVVLISTVFLTAWPIGNTRIIRPLWSLRLMLVGLVGVFLAPDFLAIPWGGFVSGAAAGALLPDAWRRPRRRGRQSTTTPTAQGSRWLRPLAALGGVLMAVAILTSSRASGWQSEEAVVRDGSSGSVIDVLVPIPADSALSEPPEFVYVERSVLQSWLPDQLRTPTSLIRTARYDVTEWEAGTPRIAARYEVVLRDSSAAARLALPITNILIDSPEVCRVDGRVATLLPLQDGAGLVVEIPAAAPREAEPPTSDTAADEPRVVTVELDCRPRLPVRVDLPPLDLGVPSVLDTQVTFRATGPQRPDIHLGHRGVSIGPSADGLWRVELGGVTHLTAAPGEVALARPWLLPVSAASVVDVHPLRMQWESRLTFQADPDRLRLMPPTVALQLPPRSILRSVRAAGLLRTQTERDRRGPLNLVLTFDRIDVSEVTIDISFDLGTATVADETQVTIPPTPFIPGAPETGLVEHLIGVASMPGFRIVAADPEGMMPGTTGIDESRLPEWRGGRRGRTAQATFKLDTPRAIEIPLVAVTPSINVAIEQTLTVLPSRIDWSAQVEATISESAVAMHRLSVDPRVKVRQISVMQDSVNRLASWSRLGPTDIVIFLTEELSGQQRILLNGVLTPEDRHQFEVPEVELIGADGRDGSEVVIRHADRLSIGIQSESNQLVPADASLPSSTSGIREAGRLMLEGAGPRPLLLVSRNDADLQIDQVTAVAAGGPGTLKWTSRLRITASDVLTSPVRLDVGLADVKVTVSPPCDITVQTDEAGGTRAFLVGPPGVRVTLMEVTLSSAMPVAADNLPVVRVDRGVLRQHLLLIPEASGIVPVDSSAVTMASEALPSWGDPAEFTGDDALWQAWLLGSPDVQVELAESRTNGLVLQHIDAALWQALDGTWQGVMVADVTTRHAETLVFKLPARAVITSLTLNGQAVPLEEADPEGREHLHAISLSPHQASQRCMIGWALTQRLASSSVIPLPVPQDVTNPPMDVVLFGQSDQHYAFRRSLGALRPADMLRESEQIGGTPPSPISASLRAAGVDSRENPVARPSLFPETVIAARLPEQSAVLPIRLYNQQQLRLMMTVLVAAAGLLLWAIISPWWPLRKLTDVLSRDGLSQLSLFFAVLWLGGLSVLGFGLLLVSLLWWSVGRRRFGQAPALAER